MRADHHELVQLGYRLLTEWSEYGQMEEELKLDAAMRYQEPGVFLHEVVLLNMGVALCAADGNRAERMASYMDDQVGLLCQFPEPLGNTVSVE